MLKKLFRFLISRHTHAIILFVLVLLFLGFNGLQPRRAIACSQKRVGAVSHAGDLFASWEEGNFIDVYETETMRRVRRMDHGTISAFFPTQFSKNGQYLAVTTEKVSASGEKRYLLYIWNVKKQSEPLIFHLDLPSGFAFSPDSSLIAISEYTREAPKKNSYTFGIWSLETGKRLHDLKAQDRIAEVDWSADGARIAGVGFDGAIWIWNASDGSEVKRLPPTDTMKGYGPCAFSSDGKTIIEWSYYDGLVVSLDVESGAVRSEYKLPGTCVFFRHSPEHDYLIQSFAPEWIAKIGERQWVPEWAKELLWEKFYRHEVFEYHAPTGSVRKVITLPWKYLPKMVLSGNQGLLAYREDRSPQDGKLVWWDLEPRSPWVTGLYWASGIAIAYWLSTLWVIRTWRARSKA